MLLKPFLSCNKNTKLLTQFRGTRFHMRPFCPYRLCYLLPVPVSESFISVFICCCSSYFSLRTFIHLFSVVSFKPLATVSLHLSQRISYLFIFILCLSLELQSSHFCNFSSIILVILCPCLRSVFYYCLTNILCHFKCVLQQNPMHYST